MSIIQISMNALVSVIILLLPYLQSGPSDYKIYDIASIVPVALLLTNIICFVVFLIKCKEERKEILIFGIRNVLLIFPAIHFSFAHGVSWGYTNGVLTDRYDSWNEGIILQALWVTLIIFLIFAVVGKTVRTKRKEKATDKKHVDKNAQ